MKTKIVLMAFVVMLLPWCATVNAQASANRNPANDVQDQPSSRFAALRLMVSAKNNRYEVKQANAKLIKGVYKKQNDDPSRSTANDLVFYILNDRNETVETVVTGNPLNARLEYPGEDRKTIESTVVNKTEGEVLLRFNYTDDLKSVLVKKLNAEHHLETIATLPLNLK